ncbi:MAG TPA: methyltransferase [Thermoplasmata archaeon]|nr:methyltransferase [Thermoplasmata archaeon]
MPEGFDEGAATEHYFTERPRSPSERRTLRFVYRGDLLTFAVDRGVFASSGLDPGTALLIETLDPAPTDRVLDMGCGWGAIGIAAARRATEGQVVLTDINRRAALLARRNLRTNRIGNAEVRIGSGFAAVEAERFNLIAMNPPYHAGRPLVEAWLSETPAHLKEGGRLLIVGKGSQGILFYQAWLSERWAPSVEVRARGGGYRVLEARVGSPEPSGPPSTAHETRSS